MSSPALIALVLVNLAPNMSNNTSRNPRFYSFVSFLNCLLTPFINKPDSSIDLTVFMISFIFSFETINVVIPDPNTFYE